MNFLDPLFCYSVFNNVKVCFFHLAFDPAARCTDLKALQKFPAQILLLNLHHMLYGIISTSWLDERNPQVSEVNAHTKHI